MEQIYKQINQFSVKYFGGLTKQEIYSAIYASGIVWNEHIPYQLDWVVLFQLNDGTGQYKYAKSLIANNLGHNPNTSPNEWEVLPISPVDMQVIFDYIDNKINSLPQVNYLSEGNGEILQFNTQQDYETYKTTMGVDDSYFQNVDDNIAYVNQENTFTQPQNFNENIIMNGGAKIKLLSAPVEDGDVVNLLYFNNNAKLPIERLESNVEDNQQQINLIHTVINNLDTKVDNNQTNINNLVGTQYQTTLANVYVSNLNKIYSSSGGSVGGTNGIFFTIFTNLTINDNWEYKIKTSGDIGNPSAQSWFSSIQISSYINSQNKLVICINKLFDSNDDLEYWKNNIKIIVWRKSV